MKYKILKLDSEYLEDTAKIVDEYRVFYNQESDLKGSTEFLKNRYNNSESVVFISIDEEEKRVIGFTQLYPSFSTVSLREQWVLNDLFVKKEYRKFGIGQRLIEKAEEYFKDRAKGLILVTSKDNLNAKSLYDRCGWKTGDYDFYYKMF